MGKKIIQFNPTSLFFPISFRNSHILSIEIHIHIKFFPSKRWPPNRPGELKSKCGEPLASREV
jgi:hypothetical protein